ncbi:MAG: hypothetical protein HUU28_07950 [Planctomycetaceae bacterium]|jgi:hypothetical protein|nr:hypothetical protein [Planctomycetaceae bacterium]
MLSFCTVALASASLLSTPAPLDPLAAPEPAAFERMFAAAAVPQAAGRSLLGYTYIEGGYFSTDVDAYDEATDSVYLRGSLDLFDLFYLYVEYAKEDLENVDVGAAGGTGGGKLLAGVGPGTSTFGDFSNRQFALGVGVHLPLAERVDVVGEAAWLYADIDSDQLTNLDDTNDGWTAFTGLRWIALPWPTGGLELNGGARWTDLQALLSEDEVLSWEVGARAHFLEFASVGLRYQIQEDDSTYALNARLSL